MENKPLVKLFPDATPALAGQAKLLKSAYSKYGDIPKFFGAFYTPIGLEFEVEKVVVPFYGERISSNSYWNIVKDGSLRGASAEFVSLPIANHNIDYALHELQDWLTNNAEQCTGSVRTSIHVHADVSAWDSHTLYNFTALYAMLEDVLFTLHDETRQQNAYCYRITSLNPKCLGVIQNMKYCALNLAPVASQFTVEFRHSEFSTNWRKHRRWIQIVCKLIKYCTQNSDHLRKTIEDTIINDSYQRLFETIFGKSADLFSCNVPVLMERNSLWAVALLENV